MMSINNSLKYRLNLNSQVSMKPQIYTRLFTKLIIIWLINLHIIECFTKMDYFHICAYIKVFHAVTQQKQIIRVCFWTQCFTCKCSRAFHSSCTVEPKVSLYSQCQVPLEYNNSLNKIDLIYYMWNKYIGLTVVVFLFIFCHIIQRFFLRNSDILIKCNPTSTASNYIPNFVNAYHDHIV